MKKTFILLSFCALLLSSCEFKHGSNDYSTHFPFKESKNDKWGLMDANGKIIVENEFSEQPTTVVNGMFFVGADKGIEMYSLDKPLTPVGDIYKDIVPFTADITPAVREDEGIKFIDKQGNVKFELPLEFTYASNFENGYSIVTKVVDEELSIGVVSLKGEIKFFKKYNILDVLADGSFVAEKEDDEDVTYLLDIEGNVKTKINYDCEDLIFSPDGKYYIYMDEDENFGLRSVSGESVLRAKYNGMFFTDDGNLLFGDEDENIGIMNLKGEVIVKPRYQDILGYHDGLFIVSKEEDGNFGLLNLDEERLIDYDYSELYFIPNSNNLMAVSEDEKSCFILNRKGNVIADLYSIDMSYLDKKYFFVQSSSRSSVESDYFDVLSCIKSMLYPNEKSVNNLFGFVGKHPSDCADELDLSLSYDDITDDKWFPEETLTTNYFGTVSYQLGFEKAVDIYYSPSDYYELWPKYSYSDKPCNSLIVNLDTKWNTYTHMSTIEKQIDKVMEDCGFYNKFTSNGYTWYNNADIKVRFEFKSDIHMYVYVTD